MLLVKDMDAATTAKRAVKKAQRKLRTPGATHGTRFFELRDNRWAPRIQLPRVLKEATATDRRGHGLPASEGGATATTEH
ncbi:hypothetical protein EI94DRAFT_1815226 [Lactarius quietus]|nr:hypothetical protein EI94DRAFT_1815226 [Lactarius quietus]